MTSTVLQQLQQPYRVQPKLYNAQPVPRVLNPLQPAPRFHADRYIWHNAGQTPVLDTEPWFIPLLVERFEQEYNTEIGILGGKRKGKSSLGLRIAEMYCRAMGRPICACKPTVLYRECATRVKKLVAGKVLRLQCRVLDRNTDPVIAEAHAEETRHRVEPPTLKPWKDDPCEKVVQWVRTHIFYKTELFLLQAPDMPLGDIALFDESGQTHDAHNWQARRARLMKQLSEIWGKWRFVVLYFTPDASYQQKGIKIGFNAYIIVWQRLYARVYGLKKDFMGGVDTRWRDSDGRERLLRNWKMPQTPGLWREYNRVKDLNMGDTVINALAMEGMDLPPGWLEKISKREEDIVYVK